MLRLHRRPTPTPPMRHEQDVGEEENLADYIVDRARLRHRRVYLVGVGMLGVLAGVCLIAVFTRLSPLPLLPLAPLGIAAYALRRMGTTPRDQVLLCWLLVFTIGTAVSFGLVSWVGHLLGDVS